MKLYKIVWITIILLGLAGCTANGPKYNAYTQSNAATINGTFANFFKIVFGTDANIVITAIDGKHPGTLSAIKVKPGKHTISVSCNTANNGANGSIKVFLKANHNYKLRAKADLKFFTVYLFDITTSSEGILKKKYRINARGYNVY